MPETAKEKLKRITAWDVAPALTDGEIDALLVETSFADTNGLPPTETDWQPTYDLNLAATAAWLIKAGRAAQLTEVDPVGSGIVTSKVFDNCRAMARIYRVRGGLTIQIKPPNL